MRNHENVLGLIPTEVSINYISLSTFNFESYFCIYSRVSLHKLLLRKVLFKLFVLLIFYAKSNHI